MVGVITVGSALHYNNGCILQNYALTSYLNAIGIPAQAIYCNVFSLQGSINAKVHHKFHLQLVREGRFFNICFVRKADQVKNKKCAAFIKENINPRYYPRYKQSVYASIESQYDKVIVGSDQVWHPYLAVNDKTEAAYLLTFLPPKKRVSYAASFGVSELPENQKCRYKKALQHFNAISVREDAGKHIVEELTGRTDVQVLIDPTMLLSTQEWDNILQKPDIELPSKYLLTYFLGDIPSERKDKIRKKAEDLGCEVINLMDKNSPFYSSDPSEFVYLIKHAKFVCTDSFHCSVFSFLYQRPLVIYDRMGNINNMSSRLQTFTEKFHLQSCLAKDDHIPEIPTNPDYSSGYCVLEEERIKSKAFLDTIFQDIERAGLCK